MQAYKTTPMLCEFSSHTQREKKTTVKHPHTTARRRGFLSGVLNRTKTRWYTVVTDYVLHHKTSRNNNFVNAHTLRKRVGFLRLGGKNGLKGFKASVKDTRLLRVMGLAGWLQSKSRTTYTHRPTDTRMRKDFPPFWLPKLLGYIRVWVCM